MLFYSTKLLFWFVEIIFFILDEIACLTTLLFYSRRNCWLEALQGQRMRGRRKLKRPLLKIFFELLHLGRRSSWTRGTGGSKRKKMVVVDKVLHFLDKGLQIGQLVFWIWKSSKYPDPKCSQISAIVTLGLARLGDRGSSLQFGSSLDSHWLGQMTTAGWVTWHKTWKSPKLTKIQVIVLCSSLLGRQLGDPPAPWFDVALNICGGILVVATIIVIIIVNLILIIIIIRWNPLRHHRISRRRLLH